jgi:AraC family transcriptional regulator
MAKKTRGIGQGSGKLSLSFRRRERTVLDDTALSEGLGRAEPLGGSGGAIARLTVLGARRRIDDHTHDHPYLSLYVLGAYREAGDGGETAIDGLAAAFHPAGSAHADMIGRRGLATVNVEFDPAWLARRLGPWARLDRSRYWIGGDVGRSASQLARAWLGDVPAAQCYAMTGAFLQQAACDDRGAAPEWLDRLSDDDDATDPDVLADRLGVSRAWLVRAHRHWRGEGLEEARRRRRVETAARLIETSRAGLAEIAAEAGFCDQSHMNRAFRLLLGRTPAAVRISQLGLAGAA